MQDRFVFRVLVKDLSESHPSKTFLFEADSISAAAKKAEEDINSLRTSGSYDSLSGEKRTWWDVVLIEKLGELLS